MALITDHRDKRCDRSKLKIEECQPDVETFLATILDEVLVAADPRRLESLRGELLQLVRHEVDREGELIDTSLKHEEVDRC